MKTSPTPKRTGRKPYDKILDMAERRWHRLALPREWTAESYAACFNSHTNGFLAGYFAGMRDAKARGK